LISLILFVTAVSLTASFAQHSPVSAEHTLKEGSKAVAFGLNDQHGKERSLSEFTEKGPVALVFHRSADW
jgi:hypothetical protein